METSKLTVAKDGTEFWFKGKVLHREDGPALKRPDGVEIWSIRAFSFYE